jgi:hypothetical protein
MAENDMISKDNVLPTSIPDGKRLWGKKKKNLRRLMKKQCPQGKLRLIKAKR